MNTNKHPVANTIGYSLSVTVPFILAGMLISFASLQILNGEYSPFQSHPLSAIAYLGLIGTLIWFGYTNIKKQQHAKPVTTVKCPNCGQLTPMTEHAWFNGLNEQRINCKCGCKAKRAVQRDPNGTLKCNVWD
ncbi:MAG: hypothetical protein V4524_00525 [Patescibacteria group bacterium]